MCKPIEKCCRKSRLLKTTLREPVQRIARRLEASANRPDLRWEVNVIEEDETVNAFALPGGKMGVYTGIFPIAQTEAGLAIIMGHELGHVIARHGAERMSQQLGAQLLGSALAVGFQASPYANTIMAAYGLGAQVGVLYRTVGCRNLRRTGIGC